LHQKQTSKQTTKTRRPDFANEQVNKQTNKQTEQNRTEQNKVNASTQQTYPMIRQVKKINKQKQIHTRTYRLIDHCQVKQKHKKQEMNITELFSGKITYAQICW
jgi:hypothetical protein